MITYNVINTYLSIFCNELSMNIESQEMDKTGDVSNKFHTFHTRDVESRLLLVLVIVWYVRLKLSGIKCH